MFQEQLPGWEVEIIPLTEVVEEVDALGNVVSRYTRETNVDAMTLLERDEADIVNTVWYNTGDYIESGLLEDLSLMFQDDIYYNLNRILPSLRNLLLTSEGELPILPISFHTNVLYPGEDITIHQSEEIPMKWTWYEANDWLENDFKSNATEQLLYQSAYNFTENQLLLDYIPHYYSELTEEVRGDSPVLGEILKVSKFYLDSGRLPGIHWITMDPGGVEVDYENAKPLMQIGFLTNNVLDYGTLMTAYGQAYPFPYLEGAEGISARLYSGFGINKSSSNSTKLAAWELLKILISDEIQCGGVLGGATSVVSEFTREGVARSIYGHELSTATKTEAQKIIDSVTDEQVREYNEARLTYYEDITSLTFRPEGHTTGNVFDTAIPYFKGEITFEECVERIGKLGDGSKSIMELNYERVLDETKRLPGDTRRRFYP
jgi:hypothetical protein